MCASHVELTSIHSQQNHLLAALPPAELARLLPHLKLIRMSLGEVIYEPGSHLSDVYFPTTSIIAKMSELADGASTEIAVVGNEGIVGLPLILGGEAMPFRAVVQNAGYAYRLASQVFLEDFNRGEALQKLLLRYTMALLAQVGQNAVCTRHHSVDQQLSRLLLMSLDRLASNEIILTQVSTANMLGVRRESVTDAAVKLQRAGLIHYSRGHITVLSRVGLEAHSCECYAVVKQAYDHLLPNLTRVNSVDKRCVPNRSLQPILRHKPKYPVVANVPAHAAAL
jgi:CRP-like cAMP-binding protein